MHQYFLCYRTMFAGPFILDLTQNDLPLFRVRLISLKNAVYELRSDSFIFALSTLHTTALDKKTHQTRASFLPLPLQVIETTISPPSFLQIYFVFISPQYK